MYSEYDKNKEYDEYVKAKVRELHVLCRQYKIPFYMTFGVSSNQEGTEYISVAGMPPSMNLELKDDRFRKLVLLENNFDVIPKKRTAMHVQTYVNDDAKEGEEEISDEELVRRALEGYDEPGEALTDEEVEFVEATEKAANANRKRGLGRPKGTTKEVMQKKREEAEKDGYKRLIESAFKGKKDENGNDE